MPETVVPLFRRPFAPFPREVIPEAPLPLPPAFGNGPREPIATSKVDLAGKPKVFCVIGPGSSGKTLVARWALWRMNLQGRDANIAALDPTNRSLAGWFTNVWQPGARDGADKSNWLRDLLDFVITEKKTTIIDFGGGDVSLDRILAIDPDLHKRLEAEGIPMVACYLLTPRADDLTILKTMETAGFQPAATVLLLNEGRKDSMLRGEDAFAAVASHSVFKETVARGAAALWLPGLEPDIMSELDQKRLDFTMARDGQVPDGANFYPVGGLRRSSVRRWLDRMEDTFPAPLSSWLP